MSILTDLKELCSKSTHPRIEIREIPLTQAATQTERISFIIKFYRSDLNLEREVFRVDVDAAATYPDTYNLHFTPILPAGAAPSGSLEVLHRFTHQHAVRLPAVITEIGKSLIQYARHSGTDLFIPNDATHVIAVLGVTMDPSLKEGDEFWDEWFLSDSCLLQKTLGCTAKSERWLTSIDLTDAITVLGRPIRHGPSGRMKTVFDQDSARFYDVVDPNALAATFLDEIKSVALSAQEGDRIMVIMVAHGERGGDVAIGEDGRGEHVFITRRDVEERLALAGEHIKATIISTACYSGVWIVPLQPLSKTAANDNIITASLDEAWSLLPSSTSGRVNGGIFVDAFSETFTSLVVPRDPGVHGTNNEPTVTAEDAHVHPEHSIKRAISVRGIAESSAVDISPAGHAHTWAEALQVNITRHPKYSPPVCHFNHPGMPASMVLGGDDELSTLIRAEAVSTLPYAPEVNVTSLALGIENVTPAPLSAHVLQMMKHDPNLCDDYAAPSYNIWLARLRVAIARQRAKKSDLQDAYGILNARIRADRRAMQITKHIHAEFARKHPIERWVGHMRPFASMDECVGFTATLDFFLPDHLDGANNPKFTYPRPMNYVICAAMDIGFSPHELRKKLQTLPQAHLHGPQQRSPKKCKGLEITRSQSLNALNLYRDCIVW